MSERELEVLDRLIVGLSYREMADQLYISRNTVKTHVRHVYSKLGVASRGAALEEARRLGIT
jgi:LuxR family maltose regulon positive regulatory protein